MKQIAVLLTVFNRKFQTLQCLENLFKQDTPEGYNIKVYLTNDGCTDGTPQAVQEKFPSVKIIQGDGNLFWNRGMWTAWNCASKENDYDFYLWLNDDTYLYKDSILRLLTESSKFGDKNVIVGSTCAVGNKDKITYGGWGENGLYKDISINHECGAINGNIVMIPKYSFDKLGMNDPYFRHAAGDTDYGLRAKENGLPCITAIGIYGECNLHDRPTVWMDPSQPFRKRWKNFMSPLGNNPFEFFYFKRKHFGLFKACVTFCTMWIHFLLPWFWIKSYKKINS